MEGLTPIIESKKIEQSVNNSKWSLSCSIFFCDISFYMPQQSQYPADARNMIPKGSNIGRVNSVRNSIPSIAFDVISKSLMYSSSDTMLFTALKTVVVMVFFFLN